MLPDMPNIIQSSDWQAVCIDFMSLRYYAIHFELLSITCQFAVCCGICIKTTVVSFYNSNVLP